MSDQVKALEAQIASLKAQLAAKPQTRMSLKIGEKGTISLYFGRRFPLSLYPNEWDRVLAHADQIKAYVDANRASCEERGARAA